MRGRGGRRGASDGGCGGAGAGGAAAATAVLVGRSDLPLSAAPAKPAPVERGGGYHVSEHVASYYRSAKV